MSTCRHLPDVEALRDRRSPRGTLASLEGHIANCASCAHERRELAKLSEALQALPPPEVDQMTLRRRRRDLLARVRSSQASALQGARRSRLIGPLAILALVAVAAGFGRWAWQPTLEQPATTPLRPTSRPLSLPLPSLTITAGRDAVYTRSVEYGAQVVRLEAGTIALQVHAAPGHAPVRVRTPDGEIEDQGTTFSVRVTDHETRLVEVSDGSVTARIAGLRPRTLHAGDRYEPYAESRPAAAAEPVPTRATGAEPAAPRPPRKTREAAAKSPVPRASPADLLFEQAVTELRLGRAEHAARLFAEFADASPEDARVEDATFLRVVALTRGGAFAHARAAAHFYLARFPHGLRAREVEQLLAEP